MNKIGLLVLSLGLMAVPVMAVSVPAGETEELLDMPVEEQVVRPDEDGMINVGFYSVRVPEDIASKCIIIAEENRLSFYEPVSRESFGGGFVGGIRLYKSAQEYVILPDFERIGEIRLEDGTLWNVIMRYPTDVQFDLESEESTENYRRISEALKTEIPAGITASEGTFIPQDEADTTSIYDGILKQLADEIKAKKTQEELLEDGFSYLYAYLYDGEEDPLEEIGYAYMDLDHDGYQELLIGMIGNPMVYDVFGQMDGETRQIVSSGERDRWYVTGRDQIPHCLSNEASGGAALSETTYYILSGENMFLQTRFIYDGNTDPENPYFVSYFEGEDAEREPLPEEEWLSRKSNFDEAMTLEYQPLSTIE